ncbi:hypothetical protein MMC16_003065 [Acarospora aff. strigata]|nr:hypothetical protein [Acarospora aff. strigata]
MRSSTLVSVLFAAGAFSSPVVQKRDYVTEVEIVTVVNYVTEGFVMPAEATSTAVASVSHRRHRHSSAVTTTSEAPAPAPSSEAPVSAPSPSSEAPAPASSSEAPAPASSSEAPAAAKAPAGNDYNSLALYHHNIHRANHSADALTWDENLASYAQQAAASCKYAHNTDIGGVEYGQNIAAGPDQQHIGGVITGRLYNSEMELFKDLYGQSTPDMSNWHAWGHFSQIVWKTTKSVGCYTQFCPGGLTGGGLTGVGDGTPDYFTVCNYSPPGNYAGDYTKVGRPLGHAYVDAPLWSK